MTMHINLSPEMEGFIKNLVKSGSMEIPPKSSGMLSDA